MTKDCKYIGLMSGTSFDGIDGVLIHQTADHQIQILDTVELPFSESIKQKILILSQPGENEIELSGQLHAELAEHYADTVNHLITDRHPTEISVIGCHGQTVRHNPNSKYPYSLQLGNGAVIATRTNIPTVCDFRSADIANGGQGAPLAPAFHQQFFSHSSENRVILNIGGIANITQLANKTNKHTLGFDTGPGNNLMDYWCLQHIDQPYDHSGKWAASGTISEPLLNAFLSDPYFDRPPPKSTGFEYFNKNWLQNFDLITSISKEDVQATLNALTARTIANEINRLTPSIDSVFICGGGAFNTTLLNLLRQYLTTEIYTTTELGIDPKWVEACAFGWMAWQTINHIPSTIPSVTGANKASIAGAIYYP